MTEKARYRQQNNQLESGIAVAHTIYGSPAAGSHEQNEARVGRYAHVPQAHQREYEPPTRRHRDNPDIALCRYEDCRAYPSKKFDGYCSGHARMMKLPGADWKAGRKPSKEVTNDDPGSTEATGQAAD